MTNRIAGALLGLLCLAGCDNKPAAPPHRVELHKLTGSTVEFVPSEGQMPYCLLFTISDKGVVRQLTMNGANKSVRCEAGKPIGGVSYRIPVNEGSVRAHVFFSDRKLEAGSVAQQIYEISQTHPKFTVLDLRLPGDVRSESLEYEPEPDAKVMTGDVVGPKGVMGPDGGMMAPTAGGDEMAPADAGK